MANVTVDKLCHAIGNVEILKDVGFTINDGEFFTLIGPSGCGKTTTLMALAGLLRPTAGRIEVGGDVFFDGASNRFVRPQRRNVGLMFQSYALWPHMSVRDNLMFPLKLRRIGKAESNRRIDEVLELVEMLPYAHRYPSELSGGQQQRVALARTLVYGPSLLLLDEPLSNLDAQLRERARSWLRSLQRRTGITTVYVTHDQGEALSLSDRIAVLDKGVLVQIGAPGEVYTKPANRFVADFIGKINILSGTLVRRPAPGVMLSSGDIIKLEGDLGATDGGMISVGIRPERFEVAPTDHSGEEPLIKGDVVDSSFEGARFFHSVKVGQDLIRIETTDGLPSGPVKLRVAPSSVVLLRS